MSVSETSVKMSVVFVVNLPCVGPLFCVGTMAPVKELQQTACFGLLLDSWSSASGHSLGSWLGGPIIPIIIIDLITVDCWKLSMCQLQCSALYCIISHNYNNTMRLLLLSSFYTQGSNWHEVPQLVSSRDGTQTHVCLTPESVFPTTVVFCPSTRLFSKCQDPYIGFSFLYLGLDRLNLKARSTLGFALGSLSLRTCDVVSSFIHILNRSLG